MPSSSSALRRSERVRGLIPSRERSSSQKRIESSARSRMIRRVHLPEITSAVRQTGHSRSIAARIAPKLYFVKRWPALEVGRLGASHAPDPEHLDVVGLAIRPVDQVGALAGVQAEQLAGVHAREARSLPTDAGDV